ncbi:hypothetical protein BX600DRAFT_527380 [Xylariales sp. PMI_506]|nr:hypothetical protein BX600DRAFT_527380 [Xylariales sp. PMI_506]
MSTRKAPSAGQKVTPGRDGPISHEAVGAVAQDSLAAESDAFMSSNPEAEARTFSHEDLTSSSQPYEGQRTSGGGTGTGRGTGAGEHIAAAPTYISNQFIRAPGGPHGKNITEDESIATQDIAKNASFSEFGTRNDPGRAAEQKFVAADSAPVGGGSAGPRESGIDGKTRFDVLGSSESA